MEAARSVNGQGNLASRTRDADPERAFAALTPTLTVPAQDGPNERDDQAACAAPERATKSMIPIDALPAQAKLKLTPIVPVPERAENPLFTQRPVARSGGGGRASADDHPPNAAPANDPRMNGDRSRDVGGGGDRRHAEAQTGFVAPANGHPLGDSQKAGAVGDEEQREGNHMALDAQPSRDDLSLLHSLLGHYARQFYDVQKVRLAMGNRLGAMERDGIDPAHMAIIQESYDATLRSEKALERQMARLMKRHFMADFINQAPGISLGGFARLLSITGPLDNFATVSKVWKYLGLSVESGHAPKRMKGEKLAYSPQGRTLCHLIGANIVKVNKGPYREDYDRKKAEYESREDWTPLHRHNAAMRYAVKMLVKDMWKTWHRATA